MKRNTIRNIRRNWTAAVIAMMLAIVCAGSVGAFPTKGIDPDASVTLTVNAIDLNTKKAIKGLRLTVYRAADMKVGSTGHVDFTLIQPFAEYDGKVEGNLDPNDFDSSDWAAGAKNLEPYVVSDAKQYKDSEGKEGKNFEFYTGVTGDDGKVSFSELPQGLYLLTGSYEGSEYSSVEITPSFLTLPQWLEDEAEWTYEAQASAKPKATTDTETTNVSVRKIWAGDDTASTSSRRPASIEVALLDQNGTTLDTQTLGEQNQWSYTWSDLPAGKYSVKEVTVPAGYSVSYDEQGTAFTIKNTTPAGGVLGASREKTDTTNNNKKKVKGTSRQGDVAGDSRLPQTGQLWWPVWLLSGLAVVLVIIGLFLRMSGKKDLKE